MRDDKILDVLGSDHALQSVGNFYRVQALSPHYVFFPLFWQHVGFSILFFDFFEFVSAIDVVGALEYLEGVSG